MKKKWEDERDTKDLEEDIANLLIKQTMDPEHSTGTAKGTDAFGRTKEQIEHALLMRAGRKGIRIK